MTATTDLTAHIAVMNRVLADATKEHLACQGEGTYDYVGHGGGIETDDCPEPECKDGRAARFKGFRQECENYICQQSDLWGGIGYVSSGGPGEMKVPMKDPDCNGTGWQVRTGGLHDALAGLEVNDAYKVTMLLGQWISSYYDEHLVMPSAPEILVKSLELVIEVAELEVSSANVTFGSLSTKRDLHELWGGGTAPA